MKDDTIEKSCIEVTKELLKNYSNIKHFIKITEYNLSHMNERDRSTLGSIRYDEDKISPTNSISKSTENKAVNIVSDEMEMQIELYKNKKIIDTIDRAIRNLSKIHEEVIYYRYIERLPWLEIVEIMSYEERHLRTKRDEAIKCIAIELFGSKVFREEEPTLFNLIDI